MDQTFRYILNISIYTMNNLRDQKGKNSVFQMIIIIKAYTINYYNY